MWCHTNLRRRYRCCLGLFYVPRTVYIRNTQHYTGACERHVRTAVSGLPRVVRLGGPGRSDRRSSVGGRAGVALAGGTVLFRTHNQF